MSKGTDYHNLKVELRTFPPPEGVYRCASVYKPIESGVCCITSVYISVSQVCTLATGEGKVLFRASSFGSLSGFVISHSSFCLVHTWHTCDHRGERAQNPRQY
jgi:hypothetical protein